MEPPSRKECIEQLIVQKCLLAPVARLGVRSVNSYSTQKKMVCHYNKFVILTTCCYYKLILYLHCLVALTILLSL